MRSPLLAFLSLAMLFLIVQPTTAQNALPEDSVAPHIWWYADTHDSFVIERADGSDSRFMAEGINPADQIAFEDAAFSPSGEWFAWMSDRPSEGGPYNYKGYVVRVDGSQRLHMLDDIGHIQLMRWSRTHDWLFVAYHDAAYHMHMKIIDVNNEHVLASMDVNFRQDYNFSNSIYDMFVWSADGEEVYFNGWTNRYVLDRYGHVAIYSIDQPYINQLDAATDEFVIQDISYSEIIGERWQRVTNTVLQNIRTGQEIVIEETPLEDLQYSIYPNASRTKVLIEIERDDPLLIDLVTERIVHLPEGSTVELCEYRWQCVDRPLWSADGHFALLKADDNTWYLLDTDSGDAEVISFDDQDFVADKWYWVNQKREIIFMSQDPFVVLRYAIASGEFTSIPFEEDFMWRLFPSPDGRYIGRTDAFGPFELVDTANNQRISWVEHSASQRGAGLTTINWYDDSQWFFTTDDTMYAGGGGAPTARSIHNVAGLQRELGDCFGTCIGFLPASVLPHLSPGFEQSVVQEPLAQLLHAGQVYGVTWSPDGSQLVSYEYVDRDNAFLTRWDVSGQQPTQLARYPFDYDCQLSPFGCRLIWQPDDTILAYNYDTIATFDLSSHEIISIDEAPDPQYLHSPDGRFVLRGLREENPIEVRDTLTGALLFELPIEDYAEVTWASDNQSLLVSSYDDQQMLFWDGERIHELDGYNANTDEIDYDPVTRLLVGGSFFNRMQIWDVATDEHIASLNWNARDMAFSPDGNLLAAAGTQYITLWDMTGYR